MKRMITSLAAFVVFCFFLASCTKNKIDVNTEEVRLTAIEMQSTGSTSSITIDYSSAGKITKLVNHPANQPAVTIFNVSYNGNEIIMVTPEVNDGSVKITDTTILVTDGNNRVQKKIRCSFQEFKAPQHNPQRTYIYDTVLYEYDAAGLLKKEAHSSRDTTWFNPPTGLSTSTTRRVGGVSYTNSNGNVTSINDVSDFTAVKYERGNVFTVRNNTVIATSFDYTKAYNNKTDFANTAILNELQVFAGAPLNKSYANLPDKMTVTTISKDGSGTVTSSQSYTINNSMGYNNYGFLLNRSDPATPAQKTTYIYNK
jgi:hypothetical protein